MFLLAGPLSIYRVLLDLVTWRTINLINSFKPVKRLHQRWVKHTLGKHLMRGIHILKFHGQSWALHFYLSTLVLLTLENQFFFSWIHKPIINEWMNEWKNDDRMLSTIIILISLQSEIISSRFDLLGIKIVSSLCLIYWLYFHISDFFWASFNSIIFLAKYLLFI